jgi:hypothetical protein
MTNMNAIQREAYELGLEHSRDEIERLRAENEAIKDDKGLLELTLQNEQMRLEIERLQNAWRGVNMLLCESNAKLCRVLAWLDSLDEQLPQPDNHGNWDSIDKEMRTINSALDDLALIINTESEPTNGRRPDEPQQD